MLRPAVQEVPSMELGPPSPNWTDLLVGSPPAPKSKPAPPIPIRRRAQKSPPQPHSEVRASSLYRDRQPPAPPHRRSILKPIISRVATKKDASAAESVPSRAIATCKRASKRYAAATTVKTCTKRPLVKSCAGVQTVFVHTDELVTSLSEQSSASDMRRLMWDATDMDTGTDATDEFMNEFWGDLLTDLAPTMSNDNAAGVAPAVIGRPLLTMTGAAAGPQLLTPELHTPDVAPNLGPFTPDLGQLMDDVTDDQLMELSNFLDPVGTLEERPVIAQVPTYAPPALIDLGAILQQTEIVFEPQMPESTNTPHHPTPTPVASLASTAGPTPVASLAPTPAPTPPADTPVPPLVGSLESTPAASRRRPVSSGYESATPSRHNSSASDVSRPSRHHSSSSGRSSRHPSSTSHTTTASAWAVSNSELSTTEEEPATHYLLLVPSTAAAAAAAPADVIDVEEGSGGSPSSVDADDPSDSDDEVSVLACVPADSSRRRRRAAVAVDASPAEKYRRIRDNNNAASRRSRQQRKEREQTAVGRVDQLETENAALRSRLGTLEQLLEKVKALTPLLTARSSF